MKTLLVGGSGHVGSFITPYLQTKHQLKVLDVHPPRHSGIEYVEGSITDPDDLRRALDGVDSFVNLVMRTPTSGTEASPQEIINNYQVNTLGLHLLLHTAQDMGVSLGVHTSTFTVHNRSRAWYPSEEEVPLDSDGVYGLTKGFGEHICRYFCREFDMNIVALRITGPRTLDQWGAERRSRGEPPPKQRWYVTDEEDLANAYLAALEAVTVGHGLFEAVFIAGDEDGEQVNLSKARRLLGWTPRTHLKVDTTPP